IETGEGLEAEDMVELPMGNRWFWSNMQPARDADDNIIGIQVISHDITDRKQAEEDLRTTHERLNATLNALPDLLFEMDHEGRILDFRAPQPELLYCPPSEFLGKTMDNLLPKEASETIKASLKKALELGRDSGATYWLDIEGEVCWFEFSVAASGDPKDPNTRFVALARNITERKRRQDELKKKTFELRKEQKRLKDKNIALSQVLEQIESSRQEYQRQLYEDVDMALAPLLRKLKKEAGTDRSNEFEELEATLNSILAKDIDEFNIRYGRLTARESEICGMIKNGMTSKQISDDLSLSLLTVLKHREQIRKKLGITNKRISLVTYLRMH
ncbi:MAG: helix-turn-helix transcriptional regulator, partial [candidate division Zixibacteria bacterium]|nr:helix-turn-helix transcriptional regulator [candidate division Zixibacteria bacterium]